MLLACVVEVAPGNVLASSITHASYNHLHLWAVASGAWPAGSLTDLTLVLDDHLHRLRPLRAGQWYCFVAVHRADANLNLIKEAVRLSAFTLFFNSFYVTQRHR